MENSEASESFDIGENEKFMKEDNIEQEDPGKNELIEDEWTPDIEEIKKEAQFDKNESDDSNISDDLSVFI